MGILQKIGLIHSPRQRLLEELAELAGKNQALSDRLQRHVELCVYPVLKPDLELVAAAEARHVKLLGALLAEHRAWARLGDGSSPDGANNWERITRDLEALSHVGVELGRLAIHWEASDPAVAQRLQAIADEDSHLLGVLRKLALKTDPQALD